MNPEQELDKMFGTEEPKESSAETAQDCEEEDEDGDSSQKSVTDKSLPHGQLRAHRLNAREIS